MSEYRVYCLDGAGLSMADTIEAASDDEAISKARKLRPNAHKCELWLRNRLVAKLNSEGHLDRV